MSARPHISVHWFRRDLRLSDNHGLFRALTEAGHPVLPLFIFDTAILERLEDRQDRRVDFIHRTVSALKQELGSHGGSLLVEHGRPVEVWKRLVERYTIVSVFTNHDHEPYGIQRDRSVEDFLASRGIPFRTFKDISIFERNEVVKEDGTPYKVFTPYGRKWRALFKPAMAQAYPSEQHLDALWRTRPFPMPDLASIGFMPTDLAAPSVTINEAVISGYHLTRNFPGVNGTSRSSVHLRFGTVSVRALVRRAMELNDTWLNELIWREFFMQVLWHFPHPERAFKPAYDHIAWQNDPHLFQAWCEGRTGYPFVDAGMRELNATGHMHNRARMVVASFLTKHLLIDWRWGEAYFAKKLLDFEFSSNNGGWQWASGSGCDAAPYFRIFDPVAQLRKFDPDLSYVKRWVPEHGGTNYAAPVVVHGIARARALATYQQALAGLRSTTTKRTQPI